MSLIFQLQENFPVIISSNITSTTGEQIFISGTSFNQNIIQISGQDIYNSSNYFNVYGIKKQNISGIDNTLYLDGVGFTIPTGIQKRKYNLSVFNSRGQSTNFIQLNVLDNPIILGLEKASGLPDEYIRITGNYFYPAPNLFFIDSKNNKIFPSDQSSGLHRITGYGLVNVGTGYISGEKISIDSAYHKLFNSTSTGVLEVGSTGISGSIASLNILNSGLFTLIPTEFDLQSQTGNGNGASIILNYETFEYTGFDQFIEFKIPRNITKNQALFVENLKYKAPTNLNINDISVSKTGFQVLGNPKIYGIDPLTGYNEEGYIRISGENLTFVTGLNLGSLKNVSFNYDGEDLNFQIPYLAENNKVNVITPYSQDTSDSILQVLHRPIDPTGFSPNDVLLSGGLISVSGKNLHRINYFNIGQQNINREKITVNYLTGSTHQASFVLPDNYLTSEVYVYSLDYPNSGAKIISPDTNDKLIASVRLNTDLVSLRYFSGIQAAKYLDEVEIYTPVAYSGDYGNLTNSEIFFNTPTGKSNITGCYTVSGIKVNNTSTGIKIQIPREIQNPRAQIKVKRNRFGDEYILPSNKSFDILPTIIYNPSSNTSTNAQGEIIISGINASSANQLFFSGNAGTTNIFGNKNIGKINIEILDKQISGITGGLGPNYTYFKGKLGGDIRGTGKLFLFNEYFDTGIGYEDNLLGSSEITVNTIPGFRPPNSPIFTSPSYVTTPLDEFFSYTIQTNSRATSFAINATTVSGIDNNEVIFPPGIYPTLNANNQIYGFPETGGKYYIKIKAIDGDLPNEVMILEMSVGISGRSITSPGIVYRGVWTTGNAYLGTNLRRDVVKYSSGGTNYWYAGRSNIDSIPSVSNSDWIAFSNEFSATATQILLAERSNITSELNIGELGVLSGYIKSTNDSTADVGSGFFLGFDNSYNPGKPKFRVGNTGAYIKFDGEGLNIFGPLSGVITSSRKIIDANNIVDAEYSVAVGFDNNIESGINQGFIAGKDNAIQKYKNASSDDSSILGGTQNVLVGSYSNILGGRNNFINSIPTGYLSLKDEVLFQNLNNYQEITSGYFGDIPSITIKYLIWDVTLDTGSRSGFDIIKSTIDLSDTRYNNNFSILESAQILDSGLRDRNSYQPSKIIQLEYHSFLVDFYGNRYVSGVFYRTNNVLNPVDYNLRTYFDGNTKPESYDLYYSNLLYYQTGIVTGQFYDGFSMRFFGVTGITGSGYKNPDYLSVNSFVLNPVEDPYVYYNGSSLLGYFSFSGAAFRPDLGGAPAHLPLQSKIIKTGLNLNTASDHVIRFKNNFVTGVYSGLAGSTNFDYIVIPNFYLSSNNQVINTGELLSGIPNVPNVDLNPPGAIFTGKPPGLYIDQSSKSISGFNIKQNIKPLPLQATADFFVFQTGVFTGLKQPVGGYMPPGLTFSSYENYFYEARSVFLSGLSSELSGDNFFNICSGLIPIKRIISSVASYNSGSVNDYPNAKLFGNVYCLNGSATIDTYSFVYVDDSYRQTPVLSGAQYIYQITGTNNIYLKIHNSTLLSDVLNRNSKLSGLKFDYVITNINSDYRTIKKTLENTIGDISDINFVDVGSSLILGGTGNQIYGLSNSIIGGIDNKILGDYNTIQGGRNNKIEDDYSGLAPQTRFSTIIGGFDNIITGLTSYSTILGGNSNTIGSLTSRTNEVKFSTIIGGENNLIISKNSTVIGSLSQAQADDTIVMGRYGYNRRSGSMLLTDGGGRNWRDYGGSITFKDNVISSGLPENALHLWFERGVYIVGMSGAGSPNGISPLNIDVNSIPQTRTAAPINGIYRSGEIICIRTS